MKAIFSLIVAISSLVIPDSVHGQNKPLSFDMFVKELGEKFILDKQAIGLSIGVYTNDTAYFYNFGTTQKTKATLPTKNTVYEIGSITKTFVSYILANAVLERKLKLDDDVRKYLKESYPNLEYQGNPIRIVHLANNTSLLPDWLPELPQDSKALSADAASLFRIKYYNKLTSKDFFKALHSVSLDTIPGTKSRHSNAAAQLLAYILEGVYGMSLDNLVRKYITKPYKLRSTSFNSTKNEKATAVGYTASGKKAVYESVMPYFNSAGGLGSTSHDMVNYIKLLLDSTNNAVLLTIKKTIDIDASSGRVTYLRPDNTATPEVYSAALNWFKYQPTPSDAQIWADGGTNGFNSYLVIYPYLKSGVVMLANKSDEKIFRALPGIAYEISKMLAQKE